MGPILITLLMLTGFAIFAAIAWRKLAIVTALAPENRLDHITSVKCRACSCGLSLQ